MLVFTRTLASIALFLFIMGAESRDPVVISSFQNIFGDTGKETLKHVSVGSSLFGTVGEYLANPWLSAFSTLTQAAGMGWLIYKVHRNTQEWENERRGNAERFEQIQEKFKVMNNTLSEMSINEKKYVDKKFNSLNVRFDVMDNRLSERLEEDRRFTAKQLDIVRKGLKDLNDQLIRVASEDRRYTDKQLNIVNKGLQELTDQVTRVSFKVDQELHKLEVSIKIMGHDMSQQFAEERKHRDKQFDELKSQLLQMLQADRDYFDNKFSVMQEFIFSLKRRLEYQELEVNDRLQEMEDKLTLQSIIIQCIILCPLLLLLNKVVFKVPRLVAAMYQGQFALPPADHPERAIDQSTPALNQQAVPQNEEGIQNQETPSGTNATCDRATDDQAKEHMHEE